ncbi:Alpha/Beta hydrolase protein [Trichoderma compactum]
MLVNSKVVSSNYGDWESPISADFVVSNVRSRAAPRVCPRTGRAYFTETNGARRAIVQVAQDDSLNQDLPPDVSCQNTVYEYGAGLYDVLPDGRLIFSDQDNAVRILEPDANYSSNQWVLAIEEDHTEDTPAKIRNDLVAINILTAQVERIASGADFYWMPQFNAEGNKITWLEWDHPNLLFDACKLYTANFYLAGTIRGERLVAGGKDESVTEPRWGVDGNTLFFPQETSGCQLYKLEPTIYEKKKTGIEPEKIELRGLETSELGEVLLLEGSRTFITVTERLLVAAVTSNGTQRLVTIDLKDNSWRESADGDRLYDIIWDAVARLDDSHVLVVGSGTDVPQALYRLNIHQPEHNEILRLSIDEQFPKGLIAKPHTVCLSSKDFPNHTIYGFFWEPTNDKYKPDVSVPLPLIIHSHGGPTGHKGPGLTYRIQYLTSRGYGFFALNYAGSTSYGRAYRSSLWGNWGHIDAADADAAAKYFGQIGSVGKLGITGPSADGYNTLQCLTRFPDTFAGGVCASGTSEKTHKLESRYAVKLLGLAGLVSDEEKDEIYKERSALFHVDKIKAPLLLVHGQEDTVVPLEQARLIAASLE